MSPQRLFTRGGWYAVAPSHKRPFVAQSLHGNVRGKGHYHALLGGGGSEFTVFGTGRGVWFPAQI
jgi:hypothetical protein